MIDLNKLATDLQTQTGNLIGAKDDLFNAAETVIARKIELADKEAELTAAGVEGKNAEERKAGLYRLTAPEHHMLEMAEENERRARYHVDTAQVMMDSLRYRLRIAELMSKESE